MRNPVELEASSFDVILAEVLRKSTKLERFNKVQVGEDHKLKSVFLAQYKYETEQAEIKAKAAEEAARELAEQEGKE